MKLVIDQLQPGNNHYLELSWRKLWNVLMVEKLSVCSGTIFHMWNFIPPEPQSPKRLEKTEIQ
jgi:hypothetical protein